MSRVNRSLIPIKAHYFFFLGAMGPILPQINVIGKQIGISPDMMGFISFVLRLILPAKSLFGYLIDYFPNMRKLFFTLIISLTIGALTGLAFIPKVPGTVRLNDDNTINLDNHNIVWCADSQFSEESELCADFLSVDCSIKEFSFSGILTNITNQILMKTSACDLASSIESIRTEINSTIKVHCKLSNEPYGDCFYTTFTFWIFVGLMYLGVIGFSVSNSLSDVICFDMLGDKPTRFGTQRVWGTIGYGATALLAGATIHWYQTKPNDLLQTIAPALVIMLVFGILDIISIKWLKLPKFAEDNDSILDKVWELMSQKQIAIFVIFATIAGILESFSIYYLFWYLEEIAEETNYKSSIKLIEGCVVAAECLGGEIIFMLVSGKILKKMGYVYCLSLCFFMYAIRFFAISLAPNPWWLVPIEFTIHGCTYALTYNCIVAYAAVIAPSGASATIQGLVAGMNDGAGYAIGSIVGGQMYEKIGGRSSFQFFALIGVITGIARLIFKPSNKIKRKKIDQNDVQNTNDLTNELKSEKIELQPLQRDSKDISV